MDRVTKIIGQYSLPEYQPVRLIRESGDNKVYVVGDGNKTVLRLSKRLSVNDVQFEHDCMQYLAASGVPVAPWIHLTDGNISAITDDESVAVVFGFIDGHHIAVDKQHRATSAEAFAAGSALGEIARAGKSFELKTERTRTIFTELERVLTHKDRFINVFNNGLEFVEDVEKMIVFARKANTPIGLIHNDFRASNVLFDDTGSVVGVLDFDWSCIGPLMKDVALGALEWSFPDGAEAHDPAVFDAFVNGYLSKYGKDEVMHDLYHWVQFAALSDAATYFCDALDELESSRTILSSYMYKKFKYFSKL
jgi:Ser/Thr protein kinase RdoA (MazF antagonist)